MGYRPLAKIRGVNEQIKVRLQLSDPWEMGEALGWRSITGIVSDVTGDSWLVELDEPFDYEGALYQYVVITSRHEGKPLANATSVEVRCNMIRTTAERAASENPCDTSWWRGGHAMIGTVSLDAAP